MFSVEITLDGCSYPYELCKCDTPDAVASVVTALCRSRDTRPITIRRLPPAPPADPVAPGPWKEEVT